MIETACVEVTEGAPEIVNTPSASGKGQKIVRCPKCRVALWSHYAGSGEKFSFVRVGTLDNPNQYPPDIHIFTESKQGWFTIPEGMAAVPVFYDREKFWSAEALRRRQAVLDEE